MWIRADMLRGLVTYFEAIGVIDQASLRRWASASTYDDFKGKVPGLGPAVYQWLVMRQGVDTVKPDVHVHRFVANTIGRAASDAEIIQGLPKVAARLGLSAHALDWSIWETQRRQPASAPSAPKPRPAPSRPVPSRLPDPAVAVFIDDDTGYLAWLGTHPAGYVLNCARSPKANYVVLHRASCSTISGTPSRGRVWTTDLIKVCSDDSAAVASWTLLRTGGTPSQCGRCHP